MIKLPLTNGEAELIRDTLDSVERRGCPKVDKAIAQRLRLRIQAKLDSPES